MTRDRVIALLEKKREKSNFTLVFLNRNLYNIDIERAWGGEYPLQFAVFLFDRFID